MLESLEMRLTIIALIMGVITNVNASSIYSAEEIVGQYYSHIEIGEVKAKFSSLESHYTVSGVYVIGEISFGTVSGREVFDWLADGRYNPATKATEEKFDLFSPTNHALIASFTSKMVCSRDPWLDATAAPCQSVTRIPSGRPPGAFPSDLSNVVNEVPFSSILSKTQRSELDRQYRLFSVTNQKYEHGNSPSVQFVTTAPIILSPSPNAYMVYKKSKFVIKPGDKLNGIEILVHFMPMDTKPGQLQEIFPWQKPTDILAQGVDIPDGIFNKRYGQWKMRARIAAPTVGAWTREVRFQYVMKSPALTPPSKRSTERQGPSK
jgi:hypothetical protein